MIASTFEVFDDRPGSNHARIFARLLIGQVAPYLTLSSHSGPRSALGTSVYLHFNGFCIIQTSEDDISEVDLSMGLWR